MTEQEAIKNINTYIYSELESIPKQFLESLKLACFTLKEVEQYRAIGTPEECLRNKDFLRFLANSMNQKKYETYLRIYNAVEKDGRDEE